MDCANQATIEWKPQKYCHCNFGRLLPQRGRRRRATRSTKGSQRKHPRLFVCLAKSFKNIDFTMQWANEWMNGVQTNWTLSRTIHPVMAALLLDHSSTLVVVVVKGRIEQSSGLAREQGHSIVPGSTNRSGTPFPCTFLAKSGLEQQRNKKGWISTFAGRQTQRACNNFHYESGSNEESGSPALSTICLANMQQTF